VDSWATLKRFREELALPFDLLSDWDRETSRKYGAFNDKELVSNRKSFLIDKKGIVRFTQESELTQPRNYKDMLDHVRGLGEALREDAAAAANTAQPVGAVFYEFYSDTCSHCMAMKPVVEEFRKKHEGRFSKFLLVPFDTASNISKFHEFRVSGTPTFVITDAGGKEVDRVAGELTLDALEKFMETSLRRLQK
jgi:thiol-disulfide isomerase/thioredoxin